MRPPPVSLAPFALTMMLSALPAQDPPAEPPHHLVEVLIRDAHSFERLLALELDLVRCHTIELPARRVEVIATAADIETLRTAGLEFEVAIENLEDYHARQAAAEGPFPDAPLPPLGQGAMGGHYTWAQVQSILDSFALDHPAICAAKVSLGRTEQGRDIWMVKISDNVGVDEAEPEVLYDALHHAREPASMETTLLFMERLLAGYGSDPELTYIVDNRELYFIPVVNPDGYEYNRQTNPNGGGLWRKNRRGGFGVDLNRNYAAFWGLPGSSASTSAEDYRGPAPFSEPETAAIEAFAATRAFVQVCSCHAFAEVMLRPWAYQRSDPPNVAIYTRVGRVATAQTGIAVGPFSILLAYLGSGTAVDHHHVFHSALSWTPELGTSSEGGFWPTPSALVNIATRHQRMFQVIALLSGPALQDGEIILMSSGAIGTPARIGMLGTAGAQAWLAVSPGTAAIPIPGVTGNLLLDPTTTVWLPPQAFGSSGYLTFDFTIPAVPALRGATLHWQMLHAATGGLRLGNRETLRVL